MVHSDRWQEAERLLGTDPEYGDAAAVERRVLARLRVGLTMLAGLASDGSRAVLDCAAAADPDLLVMSRDPVLRNAFEADLQSAVAGTGTDLLLPAYLPADGRYAVSRSVGGDGGGAWRSSDSAWVWTRVTRRGDDPVAERLWFLLDRQFQDAAAAVPFAVPAAERTTISAAADLLTTLMPTVGPGVLGNIGVVGLAREDGADGPLHSVSGGDPFPATVFLAPEKLHNVWDAAGALLHEGLHLTLFEIIRCGAVVHDHVDTRSDIVPIPWRRERWSLMRVLFALHVYVHLAVFHGLARAADADVRARFGEPPADAAFSRPTVGGGRFATPAHRARHLAAELGRRLDLCTEYGRELIAWLVNALDRASAAQPDRSTRTFRAVPPVAAVALADQRRLVVSLTDPPRVRWLNLSAWLVYSLCDGRDEAAIRTEYTESVADVMPRAEALRQVDAALPALVDEGLVVARSTGG